MEKNLLYFMLGNVDMAKIATQQLLDISEDEKFKKQLSEDLSEYENFYDKIVKLRDKNEELKDVSPLAEFSTKAAITVKTLMDKSPAKMSEMLIEGFKMGVEDLDETLQRANLAKEDKETISLAIEYKKLLCEKMESYKKFL